VRFTHNYKYLAEFPRQLSGGFRLGGEPESLAKSRLLPSFLVLKFSVLFYSVIGSVSLSLVLDGISRSNMALRSQWEHIRPRGWTIGMAADIPGLFDWDLVVTMLSDAHMGFCGEAGDRISCPISLGIRST
jgi:hypothetical protein